MERTIDKERKLNNLNTSYSSLSCKLQEKKEAEPPDLHYQAEPGNEQLRLVRSEECESAFRERTIDNDQIGSRFFYGNRPDMI